MNLKGAVIGSLVVHGGLLGAFGAGLIGSSSGPPPERTIHAETLATAPLEDDPAPLDTAAPDLPALPDQPEPAAPPPAGEPSFLEDPGEPAGPLAGVIGISSVDGRRSGLPSIGRGGRGGNGKVAAPAVAPPAPAPEPPAEPIFLPPSLKADRAPEYPPLARKRGIEGSVRVKVDVAADGTVSGVSVAVSSGDASLDRAALDAAAGWEFKPATEDGVPIAAVVYRWVGFTLTGR